MQVNRWHIYETMKKEWRQNRKIMTVKEVVAAFPRTKAIELIKGMIEFEIAYEHSFSKEKQLEPGEVFVGAFVDYTGT